jgi:hypothetical protein
MYAAFTMIFRVCKLAIALQLLVGMISKCSLNPVTNPNPVCSHTDTRDSIKYNVWTILNISKKCFTVLIITYEAVKELFNKS